MDFAKAIAYDGNLSNRGTSITFGTPTPEDGVLYKTRVGFFFIKNGNMVDCYTEKGKKDKTIPISK